MAHRGEAAQSGGLTGTDTGAGATGLPEAKGTRGNPGVVLWLLMAAYLLNFLDRQIVNIVAEPIKRDLGLADWQLGLLTGTAFAVLYAVATIPIARWSDRGNRVVILGASVGLWSLCTALCGLAGRFWHLLIARLFVGLGEAGCAAPAQSLIAEITPPERRARALSIYSLGVPFGALLGMVMGGVVAQFWGWRWAFLVPGVMGMVLAVVIVVVIRDPRADGIDKASMAERTPYQPLGMVLRQLWSSRSFRYLTLGASFSAWVGFSTQAFFASFFLRVHAGEVAEWAGPIGSLALVGTLIGLILGIGGAVGTYAGGRLADAGWTRARGGYLFVPAVSMLILAPFMAATFLAESLALSLTMMAVAAIFKSTWFAPTYAATASLVEPRSRATATAVMLLIVNFVGLGIGPLAMGAISTWLTPSLGQVEALRWALVGVALPSLLSALLYWRGNRVFAAEQVS